MFSYALSVILSLWYPLSVLVQVMSSRSWDMKRMRSRHSFYRYFLILEVLIIWLMPLGYEYPLIIGGSKLILAGYSLATIHKTTMIKKGVQLLYFLGSLVFIVELLWFLSDLGFLDFIFHGFLFTHAPSFSLIRFFLWFLFFGILLLRWIKSLMREPLVTNSVVMGAGAGYLLLGFIGGVLLNTLYSFQPSAFIGLPDNPTAVLDVASFGYLTTLGSSVVNDDVVLGQVGALTISLAGQLYVAILIALVLGKFHQRRGR